MELLCALNDFPLPCEQADHLALVRGYLKRKFIALMQYAIVRTADLQFKGYTECNNLLIVFYVFCPLLLPIPCFLSSSPIVCPLIVYLL